MQQSVGMIGRFVASMEPWTSRKWFKDDVIITVKMATTELELKLS